METLTQSLELRYARAAQRCGDIHPSALGMLEAVLDLLPTVSDDVPVGQEGSRPGPVVLFPDGDLAEEVLQSPLGQVWQDAEQSQR